MKKITLLLACLLSISFTHTALAGKIVKWVDKNGVVHYGDKPPMPTAATTSKVLNDQGVTVDTINQSRTKEKIDYAARDKTRKDAALLATYNSVEEIDFALQRNIETDENALANLNIELDSLQNYYDKNNAKRMAYKKANKPTPERLVQENKSLRSKIIFTEEQIEAKEKQIEETRKRYEADKARYEELKPRSYALTNLKDKQRSLADLEAWRNKAISKVEYYENKIAMLKRNNAHLSKHEKSRYLNAVREVERADAQIKKTRIAIKKNEADLSR